MNKILKQLSSLKVTVLLLIFSISLVMIDYLAENSGMDMAAHNYLNSFLIWVDLSLFLPKNYDTSSGFPFFGAWSLYILFGINLLATHIVTFKGTTNVNNEISFRKTG